MTDRPLLPADRAVLSLTRKLTAVTVNGRTQFLWLTPGEDGKVRCDVESAFGLRRGDARLIVRC
jgi:hypothetical protein